MTFTHQQHQDRASRLGGQAQSMPGNPGRMESGPREVRRARPSFVLALAPIAAAIWIAGCGGGERATSTPSAARETESPPAVVQSVPSDAQPEAQAAVAAATPAAMAPAAAIGERTGAESPETLPPDIVVSVADTLVSPGEPVAFTVEGTPDVAEVVLWDGLNDRQAFSYDDHENMWRVYYRVPLHPSHERLGLSVTARTEANRWRRLWVFLHVRTTEPDTSEAPADGS